MLSLNEKLNIVRAGGAIPKKITLDLSIQLTDQLFSYAGDICKIWESPSHTEYIQIKFNEPDQPYFTFRRGRKIITPYERLYITTPAGQTGDMEILLGDSSNTELLDAYTEQDTTSEVFEGILGELQGDVTHEAFCAETVGVAAAQVVAANTARKSVHLQAGLSNTGTINVGPANTVTLLNGIQLVAGQTLWLEEYRGPVYGIATGAGQRLNYLEV